MFRFPSVVPRPFTYRMQICINCFKGEQYLSEMFLLMPKSHESQLAIVFFFALKQQKVFSLSAGWLHLKQLTNWRSSLNFRQAQCSPRVANLFISSLKRAFLQWYRFRTNTFVKRLAISKKSPALSAGLKTSS